jgi:hypothetical protein
MRTPVAKSLTQEALSLCHELCQQGSRVHSIVSNSKTAFESLKLCPSHAAGLAQGQACRSSRF